MIQPRSEPQARQAPVRTGGAIRVAAGAGMVAVLLVCQGAGEPVPVLKTAGEPGPPTANWQAGSQPASQPATQPETQPTTQPAATQPVPTLRVGGDFAVPEAQWKAQPATSPGK